MSSSTVSKQQIIATVQKHSWPWRGIVAHRCGGALAPENSLAGLGVAHALGIHAVEFDVMLSADEQPLLMHDETLTRTAGEDLRISETSWSRLQQADISHLHPPAFAGERLPHLREALDLAYTLGLQVNLEIKPATGFAVRTAEVIAELIHQHPAQAQILLSSFSIEALQTIRPLCPTQAMGVLFEKPPADALEIAITLGCQSIHCAAYALEEIELTVLRNAGFRVLLYTINDRQTARRWLAAGVDAIVTDRPELMLGMVTLPAP